MEDVSTASDSRAAYQLEITTHSSRHALERLDDSKERENEEDQSRPMDKLG